ncbi:protein of unknown function [Hyphomicrobium sp. MC1]|nr:protein of unknown function [Hyphomicrobium sp. MC1]
MLTVVVPVYEGVWEVSSRVRERNLKF